MKGEGVPLALMAQDGTGELERLVRTLHLVEPQHRAELFHGVGVLLPGAGLPRQEHPGASCLLPQVCQCRDFPSRFSHDLGVHGAVGAEENGGQLPCLRLREDDAALVFELRLHLLRLVAVVENALLRGADGAVVKGLGAKHRRHCCLEVAARVKVGRAIARAHTDGRLSRGIGRTHHGSAAGGQNETHVLVAHELLHGIHGGLGDAADGALGTARGLRRRGHAPRRLQRAALGAGMGRKDDGIARLQRDHGLVDHRGGGIGGGHDSGDDAHRHPHVPDLARLILAQNAHGLLLPDGLVDLPGGEAVLLGLVLRIAKARLLPGEPAQLRRVPLPRLGDGGDDAVNLCLGHLRQARLGFVGFLHQASHLLAAP